MAYFTIAQCEAKLAALSDELDSAMSLPSDHMDAMGNRTTFRPISQIEASIALWESRHAKATAAANTGGAIKLIRRRPV